MRKQIQIKLLTSCVLAGLGLIMTPSIMAAPTQANVLPRANLTQGTNVAQGANVPQAAGKALEKVSASSDSLSLSDVLEKVLMHSPELALYPHDVRLAEAMALQASLKPNPNLTMSVDNVLGTGQMSGVSGAEINVQLSQVIELGDKRQRRVDYADAKQNSLHFDYEKARIRVLGDATKDYYQVLRLASIGESLQRRILVEEQALATSQGLAKAGAVAEVDVSTLDLGLSRSRLEAKALANSLLLAKLQLSSRWLGQDPIQALQGKLTAPVRYPVLEQVLLAIETAPEYLALLSQSGVRQAKYRLELANGESDLDTRIGLRRNEAIDDTGLTMALTMPLNLINPNEGNILAAKVSQQRLQEQQQLLRKQLRMTLTQAYYAMMGQVEQSQIISTQLLPKASKRLRDTQVAYEAGQANVLQLADAQSQVFSLERAAIEADFQSLTGLLSLETITGQSLTNISQTSLGRQSGKRLLSIDKKAAKSSLGWESN